MDKKFYCDKIVFENHSDENYLLAGFSNNGDNPTEYVIMQRALSFDEQDIELGMNTYYFEYCFGDNSFIGYGVCKKILILKEAIVFKFKPNKSNIKSLVVNIERQQEIYDGLFIFFVF